MWHKMSGNYESACFLAIGVNDIYNAYRSAKNIITHGAPTGCSTSWWSPGRGSSPVFGGPGARLGSAASLAICGALSASGAAIGRDEARARKLVEGIALTAPE